jgi:hypothetical protein
MGRWSRALARPFLAALAVPRHSRWLEVGCGTGALTPRGSAGNGGTCPAPAYVASLPPARRSPW